MILDKPYYIIDFSVFNCFIDIRVNDVSVFCLNMKEQTGTTIPINNVILESGVQRVTYNILPLLGETELQENADFKASVCLYDANRERIEKVEKLNSYRIPKSSNGIPIPFYKHEDVFKAEVPYKLDAWQNSIKLGDIPDLRWMVDKAYKDISSLFEFGRYNDFGSLINERENNIATCMYLSEIEKTRRINSLIDILQNGFKIVPVSYNDIMLTHGYEKLVTLKKPDSSSALLLRNPQGEEINIELNFHLKQGNNELSII